MLPTKLSKINPSPTIAAEILAKKILYRHLNDISQKLTRISDTNTEQLNQLVIDMWKATDSEKILNDVQDIKFYKQIVRDQTPNYSGTFFKYMTDNNGLNINGTAFLIIQLADEDNDFDYYKTPLNKTLIRKGLKKAFQIYHQIYH